jgi:hypothetical protein
LATPAGHNRDPLPLLRFVLTLWTDDPALAARADRAGIDRIGIDIETLGKWERQSGLGTWISPHAIDSLPALKAVMNTAQLFARTNPIHDGTQREVDVLLDAGVQVVMLPMFSSADEVRRFTDVVEGRAEVVLLLERVTAAKAIDEIVAVEGVSEVHIGINDFTLDLGLPNRFLALTHSLTADVSRSVRAAGKRFGIGGIGRVDDDRFPVPSDLVYAQYPRLDATAALISRAFLTPDPDRVDLVLEVARARERLAEWFRCDERGLIDARDQLAKAAMDATLW